MTGRVLIVASCFLMAAVPSWADGQCTSLDYSIAPPGAVAPCPGDVPNAQRLAFRQYNATITLYCNGQSRPESHYISLSAVGYCGSAGAGQQPECLPDFSDPW